MNMRARVLEKLVYSIIILCFPAIIGWQNVELKELLVAPGHKGQDLSMISRELTPYEKSAYNILAKAASALMGLKTMEVETELWLESELFHIKSDFKNNIRNVDDYKTDGRISLSFITPEGVSTSQWVQSFLIGGIPFTWNRQKRLWEKKELEISGKDARSVLSFSVLRSMFSVNDQEVDPGSVKILGVEERKGRPCFILGYNLDPEMFRRWNLIGSVSLKLWIRQDDFLPQMLRAEGKIGEMYLLQVVNYSNFNQDKEIVLPQDVSEEVRQQKDGLKARVKTLIEEVSQIRGWKPLADLRVKFCDRKSLKDFLEVSLERYSSREQLEKEGNVFRWLGLLADQADYRENLINSEMSSLAGFYDPGAKTIFIGDWINPALAETVLVHEIVHAFQDRQISLEAFRGDKLARRELDFSTARKALLEGEATAIMLEYLLRKEGTNFQALGDIFPLIEDKLIKNSQYSRQNLQYNIYGYGANFIQDYLRDNKWPDLEGLYAAAPVSMAQILHPYRSASSNKPKKAVEADTDSLLKEVQVPVDWQRIYNNRLGEFYLLVSLRQLLEKDRSEQAVSGWKDDRITLYKNSRGQEMVVLQTKWNSSDNMKGYLKAFREWLVKRYINESSREKEDFFLTSQGCFYLKPANDELMVVWSRGQTLEEFEKLTGKISLKTESQSGT